MLYLESYLFDPDLCTGDDCDNLGLRQINKLRLILVQKDVLQKRGVPFSPAKQYFKLDSVSLGRLKLSGSGINTFTKLSAAYQNIINAAAKDITDATTKAYKLLEPALSSHFNSKDPTQAWSDRLKVMLKTNKEKPTHVQFV